MPAHRLSHCPKILHLTVNKNCSKMRPFFQSASQVSLSLYNNKDYVDLSDYWKSGTWDIIEVPAYLNVFNDSTPTETDITFYITIRRKTLFYTVNLILPTVLISFLCVLVFYLPAEVCAIYTLIFKAHSPHLGCQKILPEKS